MKTFSSLTKHGPPTFFYLRDGTNSWRSMGGTNGTAAGNAVTRKERFFAGELEMHAKEMSGGTTYSVPG